MKRDSIYGAPAGESRRSVLKAGFALSILALWQTEPTQAQDKKMAENKQKNALPSVLSYDDVRAVSPALEHYTKDALIGGVWKRPQLTPRDRSIVTVSALIARI
jgi:4-carboxymuconolactone decarboxylase